MSQNDKILILAVGARNLKKAGKLRKRLISQNRNALIISDCLIDSLVSGGARGFKYYRDLLDIKYLQDRAGCHNLMRRIENSSLDNGQTFKELVDYKGVSLFGMSEFYLLARLVPFWGDMHLLFKVIEYEHPAQAIIISEKSSEPGDIFAEICRSKGIPLRIYGFRVMPEAVSKYIADSIYFLKRIWRFLKSIHSGFKNLAAGNHGCTPEIIFFNHLERYLDSMLPLIKKYRPDQRMVINIPYSGCEKRLKAEGIACKDFYGYLTYRVFGRRQRKILNNIWRNIRMSASFKSVLNYKGVSLWPLMEKMFRYLVFCEFAEQIRNTDIIRRIIKSYNPKCVVAIDYSAEVVLPAKSLSVPTFAVMSSNAEEFTYFGKVISDYIAASGNYWRDIFVKLGAKKEQVVVVGPVKFDTVIDRKFYKEEILSELGLEGSLKTVVYIGNYWGPGLYYEDYLLQIRHVYRALAGIRGVNLLTKMHPYVSDPKFYKTIAQEERCENMRIIRDYNIWKILHAGDLFISDFSTATYEAVMLDKDVLLLCYTNKYFDNDIRNFQETEAALFINDFSELPGTVNRILNNSALQQALKRNRQNYLKEHAWPLDGRASCRLKEFMDQVLLSSPANSG